VNRPGARKYGPLFFCPLLQTFVPGRRMMDLFDVEAVEAAEASIDAFINKRSKDKEKANEEEELWKASTGLVNAKRRRANRQAWIDHHGHMNLLHLGLAAEHADKRSRLMLETEPDDGPEAA
jgi:hypothetical protein